MLGIYYYALLGPVPLAAPIVRSLPRGLEALVMRLLLRPPETEVSTLLLFLMRELGGLALMLSVLFFFASRDPVRNVAIVNGLIVGLCILAITPLLSLYTLDVEKIGN